MKKTIIDISNWNIITNYSDINTYIDGVIVKAGSRKNNGELKADPKFTTYIKNLSENGVAVGAYFNSSAIDEPGAEEEADFFIKLVEEAGVNLSIPLYVYCDSNISEEGRTKVVRAFIKRCNNKNYNCGLYIKTSWIGSKYIVSELKDLFLWCNVDSYDKSMNNIALIRASERYSVPGISGFVNSNYTVIDDISPYIILEEAPAEEPVVKEVVEAEPEPVEELIEEPVVEEPAVEEPIEIKEKPTKKAKPYKLGASIKLKDAELYKTSVSSTVLQNLTGTFYIANERVLNNRIRVSESKSGDSIGWITI